MNKNIMKSCYIIVVILFTFSSMLLAQDPKLIAHWPMDKTDSDTSTQDVINGFNGKF